jgi:transposase
MILGIDVAKVTLDVTLLVGEKKVGQRQFGNRESGIAQLLAWLRKRKVSELHVCLEATNVYWEAVAEALHGAGYVVSVVNPTRIKGYALSQLRRTKTDKLDSEVIAAFCAAQKPDPWQPPSEAQRKLRALQRLRQDLVATRTQQKNRLGDSRDADVKRSLQKVIETLQQEIETVEQQIAELTKQQATLREQKALLVSIPGIGDLTAHGLLAEMYDLAHYKNAHAAAADAGLSPAAHESGTSVRKRRKLSKLGKAAVRGYLYLPTLNAMRTNPIVREFAQRLRRRHKLEMVIIAAAMRKLLHLAYGVLKNQTPFDPNYGLAPSCP